MSIIWADFPSGQQGVYGTTTSNMLDGVWAQVSSNVTLTNDPDPNIGSNGKVIRLTVTNIGVGAERGGVLRQVFPQGAQQTSGVAFRLWFPSLPVTASEYCQFVFSDIDNVTQVSIKVMTTGQLQVFRGNANTGTLLGTTTAPVITANSWNHLEAKVKVDNSTGTVEIRVNGVTVLNLTSQDTQATSNSSSAQFLFCNGVTTTSSINFYIKDYILWDTNGSVGNNFVGSVAVHDLYPDADISLNWTPSTGATGWNLIDETTPNDADYISAPDPAPAAYVASLTDLPEDVTSVKALVSIVRAVKTDGGDCNIQIGLTPNNTDWDNGADRPMTTAYTFWWDVSEVSPDTLTAWTPIEVNNAYVRANRTL